LREHLEALRREVGVAIFLEALLVGLRGLGGVAHDVLGDVDEARSAREVAVDQRLRARAKLLFGRVDPVPRVRRVRDLRVLRDACAQRRLGGALAFEQRARAQDLEERALALEIVLESAVTILRTSRLLGALRRVSADRGEAILLDRDARRAQDVALEL